MRYSNRGAQEMSKAQFFADKDRQFKQQQELDQWPADNCQDCRKHGGCCQSYNHHLGDNCLHCGNDERKFRRR